MSETSAHYVAADDPVVVEATNAVQSGDLGRLDSLLTQHPWLATAHFGDPDCHRTLLPAATDWPGNFPNGPAVIRRVLAAGADVNAHSCFESHTETPLHWAASSNDIAALDAGADIEATGAVLGGGTALADACGFGNWAAGRRLVERGARTRLKDAAALGLLDRVEHTFTNGPTPTTAEITQAIWSACKGNQPAVTAFLLERGADINWVGWDNQTPLDVAETCEAADLAQWLRDRGARRAADLGS